MSETNALIGPRLAENGLLYYELTEQFVLYKPRVSSYVLGEQYFWASNLTGYASIAFICPFCGNLWARRRFLHMADWVAWLRPCKAHGGGSLLDQGDFNHIDTMPRELMKYELSIFNGG